MGRLYDTVLVFFDSSSGRPVVILKPGDVPEISPRFVTRRRCIGFKSDKCPIISEPHNSDMESILDITNRVFCNSGPMVSPVMHYPADIPMVLARRFLFASILPAYSPTCPHSDGTGDD